jgi:hypothetical protein
VVGCGRCVFLEVMVGGCVSVQRSQWVAVVRVSLFRGQEWVGVFRHNGGYVYSEEVIMCLSIHWSV